jgi:capsular exopolysaccharide synthesis family protein
MQSSGYQMNKGRMIGNSEQALVALDSRALAVNHRPGGARIDAEVKYRALLRRHGRAIIVILLSSLAASGIVTCLMTPSYKATTIVEVLPVNQDFMNNREIDPNLSSSTMDSYLETQTKLLKSDAVLDRAAAVLSAKSAQYLQKPESAAARLERWLGVRAPAKSAMLSDIKKTLAGIKVQAEGQSTLISITVTAPYSQLASDAANAVASQHILAIQDARWAMATETTEFLGGQLSSLRSKLQQSENELQAYAQKSGIIFASDADRESVSAAKLREVQSDLEKAEADRADKQSQLELINSSPADALPKVLDDGGIRDAESKLADLRRQAASLSDLYTPKHYKVTEVKAQIEAVEEQIKAQRALIVTRLKNDYHAALRREQIEKEEYNRQLGLVTGQSSKQVGYNLLKREVDANRDLYQSMLQRIREASVVAALRASNIRVVDPAKRPDLPYQPNLPLNLGIGTLCGFLFSILFVLLRERTDGSIRTAGETTKVLRTRELAIVPAAKQDVRTQIVAPSSNGKPHLSKLFHKVSLPPPSNPSEDVLKNWKTAGSVVAESFRSAVASIILWGRDKEQIHKVLVITSAHSGAGKTTSVLNLGLGLAESGRRVLLIDGDLRIPRLGQVFGLDDAPGLTNLLVERLHPVVASELIRESGVDGLDLLPSGPLYMNVAELLHVDDLRGFLEYARSQYDFVLIDSPPALPLTDARLLAQHADAVVFVVKAGATTVEQTQTIQECFQHDGTHIFGSILNHWDARREDPSYLTAYMKYAVSSKNVKRAEVKRSPRFLVAPAAEREETQSAGNWD